MAAPDALKNANLALRFLLELAALAALAHWGYRAGGTPLARAALAVAAPFLAAAAWGAFVAPKARFAVGEGVRYAVELAVFGAAAAALLAVGRPALAAAFLAAALVTGALVRLWGQ